MKTVIGLFPNLGDAESSMNEFVRLGFPPDQIGLMAPVRAGAPEGSKAAMNLLELPDLGRVAANDPMLQLIDAPTLEKNHDGAMAALVNMGVPQNDAVRYVEGIRSGGTLEAVRIDDDKENAALAIMRRHAYGNGGGQQRVAAKERVDYDRAAKARLRDGDIVIPVVDEELRVGKREYDAGGVRVTTHVSARPVDQTITVREERVNVQRRVVDRPIDEGDEAYRDRAFDLTSFTEEPLVTKRAHVVEEIRIHKDSTERVERIQDTLRHTDVRVSELAGEQLPGKVGQQQRFDKGFYTDHYNKTYAGQNYSFEYVEPAYRFGEGMRYDFAERDWDSAELKARPLWEKKHPGTWEKFREAIRAGWHRATGTK